MEEKKQLAFNNHIEEELDLLEAYAQNRRYAIIEN